MPVSRTKKHKKFNFSPSAHTRAGSLPIPSGGGRGSRVSTIPSAPFLDSATAKLRKLQEFNHIIKNAYRKIVANPDVMQTDHRLHTRLVNYLNTLTYINFRDDMEMRRQIGPSGLVDEGLKLVKDTPEFGDSLVGMANELYQRFNNRDFRAMSAPLTSYPAEDESEDEDLFGDRISPEPVYKPPTKKSGAGYSGWTSGSGAQAIRSGDFEGFSHYDITMARRQLFRGLERRSGQGSYRCVDTPRSSAVFGDNGIAAGTWWPYREAARRDGAHGAIQAGIYGTQQTGAYSVVCSGGSAYESLDEDKGEEIWYSGSINSKDLNPYTAVATRDTNKLRKSVSTGVPVRVIRGYGGEHGPDVGYRYDGLYKVIRMEEANGIVNKNKPVKYFRFLLKREPGQEPLANVMEKPSELEMAAYWADKDEWEKSKN